MGVKQYIMAEKKGMVAPTAEDYREEGVASKTEQSEGYGEEKE